MSILHIDSLLAYVGSIFSKFFSDVMLKFVAFKALAVTFITVTLPIVLKNMVNWMMEQVIALSQSNLNMDDLSSATMTLTGIAGYFASHLLLPDCIAIIVTGIAIRFVLNFIPFVG